MRVLIVGLNPSPLSADVGVGFFAGEQLWPAALTSAIVARGPRYRHTLVEHGVGFTDLVKRATVGAKEIGVEEYRAALSVWKLCVTSTTRNGALRRPRRLPQGDRPPRPSRAGRRHDFAGARCYVMPNPSGLNAHTNAADIATHLRTAYGR